MSEIDEKLRQELDSLIEIANTYRDGTISESLFYDVLYKYRDDIELVMDCKNYLEGNKVLVVSGENDVEDMDETYDFSGDIKPYDPVNIDISLKNLSLSLVIDRMENDEIDLFPDFQRKGGLWNDKQKSQLIESLLLRIPLPAFYFDGSYKDRWIVIDGLQRLTTLNEFFVKKTLRLSGLEFLHDLEGCGIDDLPRVYKRRMNETQIIVYIINPGAPVNLKYNIFKRINTGGIPLEPQEIRCALYQGFATEYLKELASLEVFKIATGYSIKTERMLDREVVLRFIAFYELGIERYRGAIDLYLNMAMEYVNKNYNETYAEYVKKIFITNLKVMYMIFGKFAFRKMPDEEKKRPISKALFESFMVELAYWDTESLTLLIERKDVMREKYMDMCRNDKEFDDSLRSAKVVSVKKRFEKIHDLIEEVLKDD